MKVQIALDRVSVEEAVRLVGLVKDAADIVEVGTSLIKEYGLSASIGALRAHFPKTVILADLKTCDEGAYEFRKAYEAGADIATVMGFSSDVTIRACADVAAELNKQYLIDLLEVSDERVRELASKFPEGIFGIHLPADLQGVGLVDLVSSRRAVLSRVHATAAAGGVCLEDIPALARAEIDIAIVGSEITKAESPREAASAFMTAAHVTYGKENIDD